MSVLHHEKPYDREGLHSEIVKYLPGDASFFIIIMEHRRFEPGRNDVDDQNLYLPYLSFGFNLGEVVVFETPNDIIEFLLSDRISGYSKICRAKSIVIHRGAADHEIELVCLVEQIILSFYYAYCHFDNFMSNASRRFIRNYLRGGRSLTIGEVVKAIRNYAKCEVIHVEYDVKNESSIIENGSDEVFGKLNECPKFSSHIKSALRRRGTFSGRTTNGYGYVISVASPDRSYGSIFGAEYSINKAKFLYSRKRHILILARLGSPISLDSLKFCPDLFNLHLNNDAFSEREQAIFQIYREVASTERRFGLNPPANRGDVDQITKGHIDSILNAASRITAAELLIVRLYRPFSNDLVSVSVAIYGEALEDTTLYDPIALDHSAISEIFLSGKSGVLRDLPEYTYFLEKISLPELEGSPRHTDLISGFAFPIRIGQLNRGILECYSSRRAEIQFDEEYLRAISDAVGDAVHRIEIAADVSWLSRLSFLHSARHELENFLTFLTAKDRESLRAILKRYSGLGKSLDANESISIAKQFRTILNADDFLGEHNDAHARNLKNLEDEILIIEKVYHPDDVFKFIFLEIISTLANNAIKHSEINLSDFSFEANLSEVGCENLVIRYISSGKRIKPERARRVTVSPIPDSNGVTYHYGLFLLSAQVRMNGGSVHVNTEAEVDLETVPFDICFVVPLNSGRDSDEH